MNVVKQKDKCVIVLLSTFLSKTLMNVLELGKILHDHPLLFYFKGLSSLNK